MPSLSGMREPCSAEGRGPGSHIEEESGSAYVALIQHEMEARRLGLRRLELLTRINRARLGRILHRDPAKRHAMTLAEFQALLRALGIDPIEAIVIVELIENLADTHDARFAKLAVMMSTLLRGLPQRVVAALSEVDGMDGSEIRKEWGTYFQSAVVNRMVQEVGNILARRARLNADEDPFSF